LPNPHPAAELGDDQGAHLGGVRPRRLVHDLPQFAVFDPGLFANQAHNDRLQWRAEGGLPLLAVMLRMVASILRPMLRSIRGVGFLIVMLHGLVDYLMRQLQAFASLIPGLGALIAAEQDSRMRGPCDPVFLDKKQAVLNQQSRVVTGV
jgi:hypothetical protein